MTDDEINKKIQELLDLRIMDIDDVVDILSNGVYVLPQRPGEPKFAIRALVEYCKDKGIDTSQLTDEELDAFVINRDDLAEPYKNGTLKISESLPYDYNNFYKDLGIPDRRSPEEILELIQGYVEYADKNKKEAEMNFTAQSETVTKGELADE